MSDLFIKQLIKQIELTASILDKRKPNIVDQVKKDKKVDKPNQAIR